MDHVRLNLSATLESHVLFTGASTGLTSFTNLLVSTSSRDVGVDHFSTAFTRLFSRYLMNIASLYHTPVVHTASGPFGRGTPSAIPAVSFSVWTVPSFSKAQESVVERNPLDWDWQAFRMRLAMTTSVKIRSPTTMSSSSRKGFLRVEK